jgi:alpha-1,3-glucan synthase
MDYKGEWQNHTYHPSPDNWRFPFYTVMLDKWVNGDPTNDNSNGTVFEHDLFETQLRHGGDIRGLMDSLDYLQGMGIKVYTFHVLMLGNLLFWDHLHQCAMGVGRIFGTHPETQLTKPLDLTLIDPHLGTIDDFREAITEIHRRGMYILLDNTVSTYFPALH